MATTVLVMKAITGTAVSVSFVSMVKNGTPLPNPASVKSTMFGTETSARGKKIVQEVECSTRTTKCASVPMVKPGTEPPVLLKNPAAVENNGMKPVFNVTAQLDLTGMVELASSVPTVKCGIQPAEPASVNPELNGTTSSAP